MDVRERLSLEAARQETLEAAEHVHRYELAAELCKGLRVLDLCCGTGYGTRILRAQAAAVTGVDRDVAAVDIAQTEIASHHDVRFQVADALEYLSQDLKQSFDAIVCFEGLEHLPDQEAALERFGRHAEAGMKLVISVPNSRTFGEENPFHLADYDFDRALAAFRRLGDGSVLYQFIAEGSLIRPAGGERIEAAPALRDQGEDEYANNFIACVNFDADAPSAAVARMTLTVSANHNRYMHSLELANRELWRNNARIARNKLAVSDSAAASLLAKVEAYRRAAEEAEERASAAEAELARWHARTRTLRRLVRVVRRLARGQT